MAQGRKKRVLAADCQSQSQSRNLEPGELVSSRFSPLGNINLISLVSHEAFSLLPSNTQQQLMEYLPEMDRNADTLPATLRSPQFVEDVQKFQDMLRLGQFEVGAYQQQERQEEKQKERDYLTIAGSCPQQQKEQELQQQVQPRITSECATAAFVDFTPPCVCREHGQSHSRHVCKWR